MRMLLRKEYDYYRAFLDGETANTAMKKALGEVASVGGVSR
jgi:hypothetical protein